MIFVYVPDFGATVSKRPRVRAAQFGDGYEQRQAWGINRNPDVWNLRFQNRSKVEADAILAFLDARGGVESFEWTPPDEAVGKKFICREWSRSIDRHDFYTVSASFEEVFEP